MKTIPLPDNFPVPQYQLGQVVRVLQAEAMSNFNTPMDKEIQKVQGKEFVPVSNPTFVTPDPDNSIIVLHESVKLAEDRLSKITYLLQFAETEDMAIDLANEVLDGLIRAGAQFCGQVDSYRYVVDNIFADNLSLSQ